MIHMHLRSVVSCMIHKYVVDDDDACWTCCRANGSAWRQLQIPKSRSVCESCHVVDWFSGCWGVEQGYVVTRYYVWNIKQTQKSRLYDRYPFIAVFWLVTQLVLANIGQLLYHYFYETAVFLCLIVTAKAVYYLGRVLEVWLADCHLWS